METNNQPQSPVPTSETSQLSKKERREMRREEKRSANASLHKARSLRRVVLWVIALVALGGVVAGVVYLATRPGETPNENGTPLTENISPSDWVRGNANSSVSIIEYGDFQCPACAQYHPIVKLLEQEFGKDIAFSFRHFPLAQVHPNAKAAAQAAEAAGAQGKFWDMHDMLFERQTEWAPKPSPTGTFVSYAKEVGINTDQFEKDMDRDDLEQKIDSHYQTGIASGVNSTPTFFLNGVKLDNPKSLDDFRHTITQAIEAAHKNETPPTETSSSSAPITQPNETDLNATKANL